MGFYGRFKYNVFWCKKMLIPIEQQAFNTLFNVPSDESGESEFCMEWI